MVGSSSNSNTSCLFRISRTPSVQVEMKPRKSSIGMFPALKTMEYSF
jgi:hypothetical protein